MDNNEAKGIAFKGTAEALIILIPEEMETGSIMEQIAEKVKAADKFFRGAKLKIIYRGKVLSKDEEERLVAVMTENSGVIIEHIRHEDAPPVPEKEKPPKLSGMPIRRIFFKELQEGPCKFVRGTIRGGTRVFFEGNVVILGDANPGSEIVASKCGCNGCFEGYGSARQMGTGGNRCLLKLSDAIAHCKFDNKMS